MDVNNLTKGFMFQHMAEDQSIEEGRIKENMYRDLSYNPEESISAMAMYGDNMASVDRQEMTACDEEEISDATSRVCGPDRGHEKVTAKEVCTSERTLLLSTLPRNKTSMDGHNCFLVGLVSEVEEKEDEDIVIVGANGWNRTGSSRQ